MDLNIYDYKTALDLDFTLTKAERLQVRFQAPVASSRSACRSSVHRRLTGIYAGERSPRFASTQADRASFLVLSTSPPLPPSSSSLS